MGAFLGWRGSMMLWKKSCQEPNLSSVTVYVVNGGSFYTLYARSQRSRPHLPPRTPSPFFILQLRAMPFTSRCSALLASGGQKCGTEAFPAEGFCQEHHNEYLSLKSAYERATKDAEALEILVVDVRFKVLRGVGGSRDPDEARADRSVIDKYIERLQGAIRRRREVEERFSPLGKPSRV